MAPLIRRVLLVVNPASRKGRRRRGAARRAFHRAGTEVEEYLTTGPGDAERRLRDGPVGADAVFVLGGDGTVMEVVSALAGRGVPVGVLPAGTGNLVAGVLGVPSRLSRAVPQLLDGLVRQVDLGRFPDGRCFAFGAGVGIVVDMVRGAGHAGKRWLGLLAYVGAAARSALRRRSFAVTVAVDGVVVRERVVLALVANAGALFGGLLLLGPHIRPDDGELDLCLFSAASVGEVMGITWRILRRDFTAHPRMRYLRGRRFRLASDPAMDVQADGDVVGTTPVEIEIAPGAATFLVSRRWSSAAEPEAGVSQLTRSS